jgi:hypothetical protein
MRWDGAGVGPKGRPNGARPSAGVAALVLAGVGVLTLHVVFVAVVPVFLDLLPDLGDLHGWLAGLLAGTVVFWVIVAGRPVVRWLRRMVRRVGGHAGTPPAASGRGRRGSSTTRGATRGGRPGEGRV